MCCIAIGCGWAHGTGTTQRGLGFGGDVGVFVGLDNALLDAAEGV